MKKRGLSGIIGIVVIVFLVLVAVALVWLLVTGSLEDVKKNLDTRIKFYDVRLRIVEESVVVNGTNVSFLVEREPGGDEISGFLVVLKDDRGSTFVSEKYKTTGVQELQRVRVEIFDNEHNLARISEIEVYGIIKLEEGNIISNEPLGFFDVERRRSGGGGGGSGGSSGGGTTPPAIVCGNNVVESGEECDDGNTNSNDGCSAGCQNEPCRLNSDPLGLNGSNVLFIDKNNCNCVNPIPGQGAASRAQALNPLTPWCSFMALNWSDSDSYQKILAGDIVYIRSGTYTNNTRWTFPSSGTSSNPIVISSYPGEKSIVKFYSSNDRPGLSFPNSNYISLNNLIFYGNENTSAGRIYSPNLIKVAHALNFTLNNVTLWNFQGVDDAAYYTRWSAFNDGIDRKGWAAGIQLFNVTNIWLDGINVSCSINVETTPLDMLIGDGVVVDFSRNLNVQNSFFGDCGHISLTIRWSNISMTENNIFHNRRHTPYAAIGSNHTIRNNMIYNFNIYPSESSYGGIAIEMLSAINSKIYDNLIYYDSNVNSIRSNYGIDLIGNNQTNGLGGPSSGNEIYHNTIYVNDTSSAVNDSYFGGITPINRGAVAPNNYVNGNKFYNNIVQIVINGNIANPAIWPESRPILIDMYGFSNYTYGNEFKNNILFDDHPDDKIILNRNVPEDLTHPYYPFIRWTLSEFETINSSAINNNSVLDASFVNPGVRDFRLQSSSVGRNNGKFVQGFHCPTAGATGNCRTWYGSAPDIGAFEIVE